MGNSIFQMMALGRDAEARVAKDEKAIILRTILRNSDEVLNSKADLETFAAPLIGSAKQKDLMLAMMGHSPSSNPNLKLKHQQQQQQEQHPQQNQNLLQNPHRS